MPRCGEHRHCHAGQTHLYLLVVHGVAVGPDVPQLRLKLTGVHNGVEGQCLQRSGEDVLLLILRHIGQNTLAHAGAVEVVLGADLGVDRQRPAGLHLVHIDDAVPLSHAAVGDLAVFQADLLQIGVDGADDAVLDLDGVGEAQQLQAQHILLVICILLQVAQRGQGVDEAEGGALVQLQCISDLLDAALSAAALLKVFQNGEGPLHRLDGFCGCHIFSFLVRSVS